MLEMSQLSPINMILILVVIVVSLSGVWWGWRHSACTRRLVKFAALILLVLTSIAFLWRVFAPQHQV
jgi:hypothetical protein